MENKCEPKVGDLLINILLENKKLIYDLIENIEINIDDTMDMLKNDVELYRDELRKELNKELDEVELLKNILSIIR